LTVEVIALGWSVGDTFTSKDRRAEKGTLRFSVNRTFFSVLLQGAPGDGFILCESVV